MPRYADVEIFALRRGLAVRWSRGTESEEIEAEVPSGYEVDWGRTAMDDAGDFSAPLKKKQRRR